MSPPLLRANVIGTAATTLFVTINRLAGAGKIIRAVSALLRVPKRVAVAALARHLAQAPHQVQVRHLARRAPPVAAAASAIGTALITHCVTTKPVAGVMKAAKAVSALAPVIHRAVAVGLVRLLAALARPVLLALLARHLHLAVLAEPVTTTVLATPFV